MAHSAWNIPDRVIEDHVCYVVQAGGIWAEVDGRSERWGPGDLAWVGPGIRQRARPAADGLRFFVARFHCADRHSRVVGQPGGPIHMEAPAGALALLDACADLLRLPGPLADLRLRAVLGGLLAQVLAARHATRRGQGLAPERRARLVSWLAEHLAHDPQPADLAHCVGLSEDYFRRIFRRSFGCSPRTWIARERLRHAAEALLDGAASVHSVAAACGYRSLPTFSRRFLAAFGCPPGAWHRHGDATALRPA